MISKTDDQISLVKTSNNNPATTQVWLLLLAVAGAMALPDIALAGGEPWDNAIATITGIFTSGLATAIAILVLIGLGIAAWMGKLSWKLAGGFIAGVILIFGSAAIAEFFISGVG